MKITFYKTFAALVALSMLITACATATPASTIPPEPTATVAMVIPATNTPVPTLVPATSEVEAATPEVEPTAPATETPLPAIKDGGTVNLFISSSPDTFIPQYTLGAYSRYFGNLLFLRLVRYNSDTSLLPYFAKSWDISPDGLVYTFHLLENAKWTDGEPVTSEDVVWTYNFMLNKDYKGTRQVEAPIAGIEDYRSGKTDAVAGIEALDATTVQFTLDKPYAPFLESTAQQFWILPKHAMADTPIDQMDKHPFSMTPTVTAGPLKFVKYETDQYVELERDPNFVLGVPHIEKFIFKIMKADVALAQFEKGELDATTKVGVMLPNDIEKMKAIGLNVIPVAGSASQVMSINNSKPYFADKRIRQALVQAIDRQAISKSLLSGYALVLNSPIPDFSPYFNPAVKDANPYNPEKAKQLLTEAGWDFDREITLDVPTGNLIRERSAPIIQQYLQAVGIKVKLQSSDFAAMNAKCREPDGCDLWLVGSTYVIFDPDMRASYHTDMTPPNGWNSWRWSNPEADKLMDEGLVVTQFEDRKPIYDKLQEIIADDVPVVYLYYPMDIHAMNNRLKNAEPVPVGIEWNIWDWYLEQ